MSLKVGLNNTNSRGRAYCFSCFLFRDKKCGGHRGFAKNGWEKRKIKKVI
jgi:hypothetical protein